MERRNVIKPGRHTLLGVVAECPTWPSRLMGTRYDLDSGGGAAS